MVAPFNAHISLWKNHETEYNTAVLVFLLRIMLLVYFRALEKCANSCTDLVYNLETENLQTKLQQNLF